MSHGNRTRMVGYGLLLVLSGTTVAQQENSADRLLVVATKEAPPFAILDENGNWHGVSIALWQSIADELSLRYRFERYDLEAMLEGLERRSIDVAVGALTITSQRDEAFDFTHPYMQSGLGIAVIPETSSSWGRVIRTLLSPTFLEVIGSLLFVLLALGLLIWAFERKRNPEQFGGNWMKGVGAGFWWSAVTMTTVGYGDKSPRTTWGRCVAVIWMFTSLFFLAFFTASVTSALTVAELGSKIRGPEDLPGLRVGCILEATGHQYLRQRQLSYRTFSTLPELLQALEDGDVEAVVHDAPVLRYISQQDFGGRIAVLPQQLQRENYAFGLAEGSDLRERINRQLLREIESSDWRDTLNRYLPE